MQPSEALSVVAQVAVTLAGFAGIVVVFRPDAVHQWSPLDKFRLRLLLANAALPLGSSLFAILLLTVDPPPAAIWRWCSGLVFVIDVAFFVSSPNPRRLVPAAEFQTVSKMTYYPVTVMVWGALALQMMNVLKWNRFWPFFAILFVHLIAAILQFMRMVLLSATRD
jgi:hypothetical protein